MRRVPSEMNERGERGRSNRRGEVASVKARTRRRMTMEGLERRELMAVLPMPIVSGQTVAANAGTTTVNFSAPSIAVNPLNSNNLVSVYTSIDTSQPAGSQIRVRGQFSVNGGTTWSALNVPGNVIDPTTLSGTPAAFSRADQVWAAFDRNNQLFVAVLQHNDGNNAGVIRVSRYSLVGGTPVLQATTDGYAWNQSVTGQERQPSIVNFHFVADDNLANFTDPVSGLPATDANSGNLYLAMGWNVPPPQNASNYSPYVIAISASNDSGATFGTPIGLHGSANGNSLPSQVSRPRIAVSQGQGAIEAGRITVIWDDTGSGRTSSPDPLDIIQSQSVRATGNALATVGGRANVASTRVLGSVTGQYGRVTTQTPFGVGPTPEIASDNSLIHSLGVNGANSGRLYVTYVDWDPSDRNNPAENTDIRLAVSDNGGASWTVLKTKVNDDSAFTDGKSGAATIGDVQNGLATRVNGRTQFMPSVAVDRSNGTLVMSFFDTRDDAANARVATYVATSIDGGSSFAPQTFANIPYNVRDAITGAAVTMGPTPENQAAGSKISATLGYGDHMGVVAVNGAAKLVWTGNRNGGHEGENNLSIQTATANYASGPRVLSTTSGPIQGTTVGNSTFNNTFAADGRPLIDGFVVDFDRPLDLTTFTAADVTVTYRDVLTPASGAGINVPVANIARVTGVAANRFAYIVRLDAAAVQAIYASAAGGVGTYSVKIGPNVTDTAGNPLDQNGNGTAGEATDVFTNPGTLPSGLVDTTTLPLMVTGPRVVATAVPGVTDTADNLVTDGKVSAIDVTFDRDMRGSTFTPDDIVNILGPAGKVLVPRTEAAVGTNANRVIPNDPTKPLNSVISILPNNNSFPIKKLTVKVNINHMADSDLKIELISPSGTTITLADGLGGSGQNYLNTVFDDSSNVNISAGAAPFTGTYAPQFAATPGQGLSAFVNEQLQGNWTLRVTDKNNNATTGVLNGWSLTADPAATVTQLSNRVFRVGFPEQILRGTYTLTLGSDIRSVTGYTGLAPADAGAQLDSNRNAGLDLLFGRNPVGADTLPQTFTNSTVVAIPDKPPAGTATPVTSAITVPAASAPFFIGDLNVQVSITHARDSDLKIELVGPDNTAITLADGVGGNGANFTNTIFDDQTTTSITAGTAPFAGPYRPIQALSAFNGRQLAGTWRLRVTDNANGTTGFITSWSLTATSGPTVNYSTPPGPVAIPAGSTAAPTVARSVLTIPEAFTIQALTLNLGISYPNDPDIRGDLLVYPAGIDVNAPGATPSFSINLFNRDGNVGPAGTRQNYTNTVFDDNATTPIQNGGPPFNGRFNPRQPLSVLIGQNAAAYQYVLQVTNYAATTGSIDKFGLTMTKSLPTTGLGEAVADRASVDFRIFTMDPTLPLSSSEWSPVGPASYSGGKLAGRMSSIAVDPSDPSGNTVYVGSASGGVWKTTNFLTNDAEGPTYIPLTDFGPTSSLRIGDLAVFGRNGDTNQTVIVAGTGDVSTQYGTLIGGADLSAGVGFIISYDGGVSWTLLDSVVNADAQGKALPIAQRNHDFVGMTVNKVLIDPRYSITGELVIYAAVSDPNGRGKVSPGIWRSIDSGRTWQLKRAGNATDIVFDENSGTIDAVSNPAGNLRTLFASFGAGGAAAAGVYITPNQGDTFTLLAGNVIQQTIRHDDIGGNPPVPVVNLPAPTGQRILLVKPFLTGNANQDVQYQGWVYALGAGANGRLAGLWLTKDLGQSWTRIDLSNASAAVNNNFAVPSNNIALGDYDVTASNVYNLSLFNLSLAIDPNNPNIVYLGGTLQGNSSALIRVDSTKLADAHAFVAPNDRSDGGLRQAYVTDGVAIARRNSSAPGPAPGSLGPADLDGYVNLVRNPNSPFLANTTINVNNVTNFSNSGSGATWIPFDLMLDQSQGVHQIVTMKDPLTGRARLILADDQGIFTGVDKDGTTLTQTGSIVLPTGSRNGNLQTTQFFYGAAQPGNLGAQAAQALFYGMAQDNGFPESNPDIINKGTAGYGDLGWNGGYIGYGTGVATDQTGSGTVYKYKWPAQINDPPPAVWSASDFFKVKPDGGAEVSRTFNLYSGGGAGQWPGLVASGQPLVGNFVVNPLTKNQMIMGSSQGWLFGTENQGAIWNIIAAPGDLDGTYVKAPAYGAPDPNGPGVPGALNNYVLAGTQGGRIYVTLTGGGAGGSSNQWFNISSGLVNNDPIQAIITNPNRGSHEAYAVSSSRVYRNTDTSLRNSAGVVVGAGWVDITGDLFAQTHTPFGDVSLTEALIRSGSLTSIAADWRYVIPDTPPTPGNPNPPTHPMLYVSGNGGVLRSSNGISGSANWTVFPDMSLNAPQEGGGMPAVMVTDLDLALGNINPTNGRPDVSTGPNVLLASTYGRGAYAIRLAPIVFKDTVRLSNGSDSGRPTVTVPPGGTNSNHPGDLTDLYTNVLTPTFEGLSQQSAFGGKVAITLYDATDPLNLIVIGGYNPSSGPFDPAATYYTDTFGKFSVSVNAGVWTKFVSDGTKVIRVQATDQAGTRGNLADFTFTLDTTAPGDPVAPGAPTLDPGSDSGFSNSDNYTNNTKPFVVMTPSEGNITVYLLRKPGGAADSAYQIVNTYDVPTLLNGASPTPITIQDPGVLTDGTYQYAVQQIDPAGNLGLMSASSAVITIDTTRPVAPGTPVLIPASDSGVQGDNVTSVTSPIFSITSNEPFTSKVYLKRNGVLAPSGNPTNPNQAGGSIQDAGPLADGTYLYTAYQVDLAGNVSVDSGSRSVRILTAAPAPIPTIVLFPDDDSGVKGDNTTKIRQPRLYGTTPLPPPEGYTLELIRYPALNSPAGDGVNLLPPTAVPNTGNYVTQVPTPLADGTYYFAIRVRDIAGNYSESARLTLNINNTPPAIVPSLRINPADDTGIAGDNRTAARKPFLIGNTTPGAIVDLLDANGVVQATTTALSVPDGQGNPAGFYRTQLPFELTNGTITLRARARDNVGNVNNDVGTLTMTIYSVASDYDNDGKADLAIQNPPTATWYIFNSGFFTGQSTLQTIQPYGWADRDVPVPADYDGNGRTDIAVYRATTSTWFVYRGGSLGQYNVDWGRPGLDSPVPADYDGDGKADIAVYRPSTAQWLVLGSKSTIPTITFGAVNVDKPVPGDYDGTGRDQLALYNPDTGLWKFRDSVTGATRTFVFGQAGDLAVPGDYDGVGRTQIAVYRPSTGQYFILNPNTNQTRVVLVGAAGSTSTPADIPVPRDYDGDGKVDPAVYRQATASWRVMRSTTNQLVTTSYGAAGVDMALNGPLAYRVALVNPITPVPAGTAAAGYAAQVASGQVQVPVSAAGSAQTSSAAAQTKAVVVVGAPVPTRAQAKKAAARVVAVKLDDAPKANVVRKAAKAHPMSLYDNLLHQLGQEVGGAKKKKK